MALEKLGPYRFKGVLGRGGMGIVYRGEHEETGEFHAVKVLSPTYSDDDHFRGRFESEIRALLKLNHPNIVQLISYGQEDGMLFFSMELVEGNSLFQMQRQGHRFDWRQVLAIAGDVSQGLRHAHDRGVIHRDLKPGNLLMANRSEDDAEDAKRNLTGIVKITDFGIAKSYGSSQNTGTNVLGTMDFMSPEQAKGQPTTARSDLYSLGTVMFTLLAGKPPFTSKSVEEGINNLIHVEAPPVSSVVPGIPIEIDSLVRSMMAKDPEERLPTTLALSRALEELEDVLRHQAEAKTAEVFGATIANDSNKVVQNSDQSATTFAEPGRQRKINTKSNQMGGRTAEHTDMDRQQIRRESEAGSQKPRLNRPLDTRDDYFNTVTDHLRQQQESTGFETEKATGRGKLPLFLALLVVMGIVGCGLFKVLTPPSADKLFEKIKAEERSPNEVLGEIKQFLRLYPKESRSIHVAQLGGIGEAIQYYNRLQARSTLRKNSLSLMEEKFLAIVQEAEDDRTQGNRKMKAFVTFHSKVADLSESDQTLLKHAESYQAKIRSDARNTVETNIKQIRSAMKTAAESKTPGEAREIYQSIVQLYENVLWGEEDEAKEGRRLVEEAGKLLDQELRRTSNP